MKRHGVGADVAGVDGAQAEEAAADVERQLGLADEVATLVIGEHRLPPVARPLHGPAQPASRPRHQRVLGVAAVAGAVVTADVARDHPHRRRRHPEDAGDVGLDPPGPARARVDDVAPGRGVEITERRARLQGHAGHTVHARPQPHDVRRPRERRVGGVGVSGLGVDADVRSAGVPHRRRPGGGGVRGGDHRRQGPPLDEDSPGAVARRRRRLGHDHRDGLADEARAVDGQGRVRRHEKRRAVAALERHLVRIGGHGPVWDHGQTVGDGIGAGEDGDHARGLQRVGRVDTADGGVRVWRAHHAGVHLAGERDIVGVGAAPRDQARVFLAANRLADALGRGPGAGVDERHRRYPANCDARHFSAAPSPSFSRISSNFMPTSVRAA